MEIRINGAAADIQLETEKTVGQVLSALEAWLEGSGHRLSGLAVDGAVVAAGDVEACFALGVEGIGVLDLRASPLAELLAESILRASEALDEYEAAGFDEKARIAASWIESPSARMLAEQGGDLFALAQKTFSGEGSGPRALREVFQERLREISDPAGELGRAGDLVADVCERLERLPLDLQTGMDSRAAETAGIFSGLAGKVFRLYDLLRAAGHPVAAIKIGDTQVADYVADFHAMLNDLLAAYERQDTVLVGDIAEYEMAPRLRDFYGAVLAAAGGIRA